MLRITQFPTILFYSFLLLIFLLEGLGWRGGREAAFALILLMPVFLFLLDVILKKKIVIPKVPTVLYGGFIVFSTISTIFSVDVQRSLPYLLFYMALYGVFLYVYNHQEELKKYFIPFIFIICFIFSIYSLFVDYLVTINPSFFYPVDGGQYVVSRYGSHNNIGNLLIVPLLICIYNFLINRNKLLSIASFVYFLPFFVLSYSRSAYFSFSILLLIIIFYFLYQNRLRVEPIKIFFCGIILFIFTYLFFGVTQEFGKQFLYSSVYRVLRTEFDLKPKRFTSERLIYWNDTLSSLSESFLFGVGPHNYVYISEKYNSTYFITDSSHNFFLDIFSENGVLAGSYIVLFILFILLRGEKHIYFFSWLAILLNFQTMFTFKIYSFILLFFILLSFSLRSDN